MKKVESTPGGKAAAAAVSVLGRLPFHYPAYLFPPTRLALAALNCHGPPIYTRKIEAGLETRHARIQSHFHSAR